MLKALFLDRDGIINVDHNYIYKIEDFQFIHGIFELIKLFLKHDYHIYIVTNQSGIGRGYYSSSDFKNLTDWMLLEFKKRDIIIEEVYHCPHTPNDNCICRKPNIGMIQACINKYPIDLTSSWLIGDKQSDIMLAHHAKIGSSIAIGTQPIDNATFNFKTLLECKEYLEENQDIIS